MRRDRHSIHIELTLRAPYLVHGTDAGRFGLDAVLLRNHRDRLVIPGTLITGRLVEAWQTLNRAQSNAMPDHEKWFGKPGWDVYSDGGLVSDADLVLTHIGGNAIAGAGPLDIPPTARIKIDEPTGSVLGGHLQVIEQASRAGQSLRFTGTWSVYATAAEAAQLELGIRAGLWWQSQVGALRNVGFGRLDRADVRATVSTRDSSPPELTGARTRIALRIDEPICVSTRSARGNAFVSGDVITGGTLKGALARSLMAKYGVKQLAGAKGGSALARHFDDLRITHALPSNTGNSRPLPLPQSLIALGKGIHDAARCKSAQIFADEDGRARAPVFPIDWKDENGDEAARLSQQDWGSTGRHLRVRTRMESGKAKKENLFSYEACYAIGQTQWVCDLDLSGILQPAEQAAVRTELSDLLSYGIDFIGKTGAHATVSTGSLPDQWPSTFAERDGAWIVQLVTPAQIFTFEELERAGQDLLDLYSEIFSTLSNHALKLSHFFASQRMSGGEYLAHRFPGKCAGAYRPFILTDPGSVFVFTAPDAGKAAACLKQWHEQGLPVPQCVVDVFGTQWNTNPYIPQNGFGEIAVNPQHGIPAVDPESAATSKEAA